MLKTVLTAARILNLFSFEQPEWGATEVAKTLHFSKSSASAIMISLAANGLISRTKHGRYRLSWRIAELGQIVLNTSEVASEAYHATLELVKDWKVSVYLGRLDRRQVIVVEKIQINPLVQNLLLRQGSHLPAQKSALGKVLLAQQEWPYVADLLQGIEIHNYAFNSASQLPIVKRELEQVRQQGYACEKEEIAPGICCIAAPIYENNDRAKTALNFAMLANQYYQQETMYTELIMKIAKRISDNLKLIEHCQCSTFHTSTGAKEYKLS